MSTTETGHDQGESNAETAKPRRRGWRRTKVVLLACLAVVLVLAFAFRAPSPVGHWDSAEGHTRFMNAYDKAFTDMPEAEESLDVRTDFGTVRLYRFAGSGDADKPLVLFPGRASSSPVWADNMPSLLEIGDVYTIDLLGEPGKSVQERPIENDEDHAEWLHQALDGLPEEQFHLVGLSIGGWTTSNLAVRNPEMIASMTLVDPVWVFDSIPVGTAVRAIPAAVSWLPKSWRDGFNSYTAGGAPVEDVPVADMIEAGMRHYSIKLSDPSQIDEERLKKLDIPVFAILAGESVMHDPATAIEAAERVLPADNVKVYSDASHAINGEYAEEVAEDIARFTMDR